MVAPIRYLSRREISKELGITGHSENRKTLEVVGKVGIGTTIFDVDSGAKLQVNGAIFMAGDVASQLSDGRTGIEIGAGSPLTGVGTAHHRIRSAGGSGQNLMFEAQTADVFVPGGDIVFKTGGTNDRLRILKDGNIGIGIGNPTSKLHVNGTLNVSGVSTFGADVTVSGTTESQQLNVSGVSTFTGNIDVNGNLDVDGQSELDDVNVSGALTATSLNVTDKLISTGIGISVLNGAGNTATITGPANLIIDPAVVGDDTGIVRIKGDLYVDGTQTTINSTIVEIADKVIGIATTCTSDLLTDGAGIGIGSDKSFLYEFNSGTNPSLKSSENLNVPTGKGYQVNQVEVLNATTLGTSVVNSSLTNLGTLTGIDVNGHTELDNVNVSGVSTFVGVATFSTNDVYIAERLFVGGVEVGGTSNTFSGINTFSGNTNNNLGVPNTGAVQINGGLGVGKNVTVGASLYVNTNLQVVGVSTFTGAIDANGNLDVDGQTELDDLNVAGVTTTSGLLDINAGGQADTFKVEDLTDNRVVISGTGGELEDDANLTFNGSTFSVGVDLDVDGHTELDNVNISGVTTVVGNIDANGNLDVDGHTELDNVNVSGVSTFVGVGTFNSDLFVAGNLNISGNVVNTELSATNLVISGVSTFTGAIDANGNLDVDGQTELDDLNVAGVTTTSGLLDINAGGQADTFKVEDLTDNRVVIAGTDGELEDDSNLTFNGSTLAVGVNLDVDGHAELDDLNVAGVSTFTGSIDANGSLDVDGHTELDDVNVSGASTFTGAADFNGNIDVDGHTELDNLNVSGVSTFVGVTTFSTNDVYIAQRLFVGGLEVEGGGEGIFTGVTTFTNETDNVLGDSNTGAVQINGGLGVDKNVSVGAGLSVVTGFEVGGISTFTGNIDANGNLDVDGHTELDDLNVSGVSTFRNTLYLKDYNKLKFGLSESTPDLEIYHNSSRDSFIDSNTKSLFIRNNVDNSGTRGDIVLQAKSGDDSAKFVDGGAVELYYDNVKKFETTSIGIAVSNGTSTTATIVGPDEIIIDPATVGDNTGSVRIKGDLFVDGNTTQINSTTIELADFVVGIATTATTDTLADGAGLEFGPSDNNFKYFYNSGTNPSLKSSENLNVLIGKGYQVNQVEVLNATTLGSGVTGSSLTSVGTLSALTVSGDVSIADKIIHTGDTNTAIRFPADDTVTVETAGTERFRVTSAGNVGIGTDDPQRKLSIKDSGNTFISIENLSNVTSGLIGANSSGLTLISRDTQGGSTAKPIQFITGSTEKVRISSTGLVGIGTVNPQGLLHISSGTSGDAALILEADTDNSTESDNPKILFRQDGGLDLGSIGMNLTNSGSIIPSNELYLAASSSDAAIVFATGTSNGYTNATERLRIQANGNIGIGNNNPDKKLVVGGADSEIVIDDTNGSPVLRLRNNGATGGTIELNSSNDLRFRVGGTTERLRIASDGKVGIGTDSPAYLLHVHNPGTGAGDHAYLHFTTGDTGSTGSDGLTIGVGANQVSYINSRESQPLVIATGGSERFRITSDGRVGINSTSPINRLQVKETNTNTIVGKLESSVAFSYLSIEDSSTTTGHVRVGAHGNDLVLRAGNNNRVRITSAGDVGINEATNINGRLHVQHDALAENILYATRYDDQANDKPILAITEATMTGMDAPGLVIGNHNRDIHIGQVFGAGAAVEVGQTKGIRITSAGNVGINTTIPSEKLDVIGTVKATDFNTTSDENLKTNIHTIEDPLAKVVHIRGVNFEWKENNKHSAGVIAQEVEKVLPELINGEQTKTVNYNGLIGLLIEVVKEQQTQIDSLNERLSRLE